jgi:hypothetical protein
MSKVHFIFIASGLWPIIKQPYVICFFLTGASLYVWSNSDEETLVLELLVKDLFEFFDFLYET